MNSSIEQFIGISEPEQLPLLDVDKFKNIHIHIFWKDKNNRYHGTNDQLALDVGLHRGTEVVDYCDLDFWPDSGKIIAANDAKVFSEDKPSIFVETGLNPNGTSLHAICHKAPWHSSRTDKLLGILGYAIITHKIPKHESNSLTNRQIECLYYLVKGNSIKEIAREISLSPRTVEHYLDAVKDKLNCTTRAELVGKALKLSIIKDRL